jgi:hypothetical protein
VCTSLDHSTLQGDDDGRTHNTPPEVAVLLNKFFDHWFQVVKKLEPVAMAIKDPILLWQDLVHPSPDSPNGDLPPIHLDFKIAKYLQDGLRQAGHSKVTPQLALDMKDALDQEFALEEFRASIKHLSVNGIRPVGGQLLLLLNTFLLLVKVGQIGRCNYAGLNCVNDTAIRRLRNAHRYKSNTRRYHVHI